MAQLEVDATLVYDNYVVMISDAKLSELKLFHGDTVLIKGSDGNETVSVVTSDSKCPQETILINEMTKNNLKVNSKDNVTVEACSNIEYGKCVDVAVVKFRSNNLTKNDLESTLKKYFFNTYRPVHKNDTLFIQATNFFMEFKILNTDPEPYCLAANDTVIKITDMIEETK